VCARVCEDALLWHPPARWRVWTRISEVHTRVCSQRVTFDEVVAIVRSMYAAIWCDPSP
jgi:hypothetical protein